MKGYTPILLASIAAILVGLFVQAPADAMTAVLASKNCENTADSKEPRKADKFYFAFTLALPIANANVKQIDARDKTGNTYKVRVYKLKDGEDDDTKVVTVLIHNVSAMPGVDFAQIYAVCLDNGEEAGGGDDGHITFSSHDPSTNVPFRFVLKNLTYLTWPKQKEKAIGISEPTNIKPPPNMTSKSILPGQFPSCIDPGQMSISDKVFTILFCLNTTGCHQYYWYSLYLDSTNGGLGQTIDPLIIHKP